MAGINKAIVVGNLGSTPEIRRTNNGDAVANLNIATSERWRDRNSNEMIEKTEWHRVSVFGSSAEFAETWLAKGSKVYVEGKLKTRKWQDQNGLDRYTTEIVVAGYTGVLQALDKKSDALKVDSNTQDQNNNQAPNNLVDMGSDGEDIPF